VSLSKKSFCTLACFLVVLFSISRAAPASATPLYGLLCFSEQSAEEVAVANQSGGSNLEDVVADALVEQNKCIRLKRSEALDGHIVYAGRSFGKKQVVGVSPNEEGTPQLFGIVATTPGGITA